MPVRLFLGYFVALAACATAGFASFGISGPDAPVSFAAEQWSPPPPPSDSAFPGRVHRTPLKHVQLAQAN